MIKCETFSKGNPTIDKELQTIAKTYLHCLAWGSELSGVYLLSAQIVLWSRISIPAVNCNSIVEVELCTTICFLFAGGKSLNPRFTILWLISHSNMTRKTHHAMHGASVCVRTAIIWISFSPPSDFLSWLI